MKTFFVGIAFNWATNRLNLFVTSDRHCIPVSVKELREVKAASKKQARNQFLFENV